MSGAVLKDGFWPLVLGFGVACVALVTLHATRGIAPPGAYLGWFQGSGMSQLGRMLWDLLVVGALGLGLPGFIGAVAAFRLGRPALSHWALFVAAALLCLLVLLPWLHDGMALGRAVASMARPWWRYGVELSLLIAALVALRTTR
jgi:hypothetical protein